MKRTQKTHAVMRVFFVIFVHICEGTHLWYDGCMSWGTKRRNTVLFIIFILVCIPIAAIGFVLFYEAPTCTDGKLNGDEVGIDCGGSCQLVCTTQAYDPVALWERYFRVDNGVYNVLSYVENPNPAVEITQARYVFKLYNEDNVLIAEREGNITLAPKSVMPIIETGISTALQVPTRVSFEFLDEFVFEKKDPSDAIVVLKDEYIENENTNPRIRAIIQNLSLQYLQDIEVIVIVYDVFDNVLSTSSTYVPRLGPEESSDIVFTWPNPFTEDVVRIELIPVYDFN